MMSASDPLETWMQLQDVFKQMVEAATGVKAMALENGFEEFDASVMGCEAFRFLIETVRKQQGNGTV
jgi:hypothetical protein